jgi:hypothetical protein
MKFAFVFLGRVIVFITPLFLSHPRVMGSQEVVQLIETTLNEANVTSSNSPSCADISKKKKKNPHVMVS